MGEVINKKALLITGTIIPNSNYVANTNSEIRRNEYYNNLIYYASEFPNDDIYFLENSSFDFSIDVEFQSLFNTKNVRLIKFPVSDKVLEGKGYQEFQMIDEAIEQLSGQYNEFIKITGRYKVLNLKKLSRANTNGIIADSHKKTKITETNVFVIKTSFYLKNFKNKYVLANDEKGIFIEHVIYNCIHENKLWNQVELFKNNPLIIGTSGSYGGTLNRNKYKMYIRNIERKILSIFNINQFLIEY